MIGSRNRAPTSPPLVAFAPAKINLTLRVIGRRPDGYHELESLVVFADVGDRLSLRAGEPLALRVSGATAGSAGPLADNLVIKAARALAERIERLQLGQFRLDKRLPVAAGLGGGSADAAAALRLLAAANGLASNDARLIEAARATGADVPVCLGSTACAMRGVGDVLSDRIALPSLPAVLVNPRVALATADVFRELRAGPVGTVAARQTAIPSEASALLDFLQSEPNDLEPPALALQPVIGTVLEQLRGAAGHRLARMSGSGATCFALFASPRAARAAAATLRARQPGWWVRATILGSSAL